MEVAGNLNTVTSRDDERTLWQYSWRSDILLDLEFLLEDAGCCSF